MTVNLLVSPKHWVTESWNSSFMVIRVLNMIWKSSFVTSNEDWHVKNHGTFSEWILPDLHKHLYTACSIDILTTEINVWWLILFFLLYLILLYHNNSCRRTDSYILISNFQFWIFDILLYNHHQNYIITIVDQTSTFRLLNTISIRV